MSINVEIERRYLVRAIHPGFRDARLCEITQGYFETMPGTSLRVRLTDGKLAWITLKTGHGMSRQEEEHTVSLELARALLNACQHKLEKTRYFREGWEIDEYRGPLKGLIIAEKEIASETEPVTLPPWITDAVEVTDSLTNLHLARLASDLIDVKDDRPLTDHLRKRVPRVVLTGGPCSGKSTLVKLLRREFGEQVHCVPEVATIVIGQVGIRPPSNPVDLRRFQRTIYQVQRSFEEVSNDQAVRDGKRALLLDRGVLDNAAYLPGGLIDFETICRTLRTHEFAQYDAVICLEVPPRDIYERDKDGNAARSESYEQALELGEKVHAVWRYHQRFDYVRNGMSWEHKVERVVSSVRAFLANP